MKLTLIGILLLAGFCRIAGWASRQEEEDV
jgi:hypothetical protein